MRWWLSVFLVVACADIQSSEGVDAGGPDGDAGGASDAAVPDAAASDQEVVTTFDENQIVDTYLHIDNPTLNYGGRHRMCADTAGTDRTSLIRVDVSQIPPGAEVSLATLALWTGTATNDFSPEPYLVYEILEGWNEGTQDGAAGEASWNDRKPALSWSTPGAGVDSRADTAAGTFTPMEIDSEYVIDLDADLVRRWIDSAVDNFGIVVVASGADGACFATTENGDPARRPRLAITWTAP